MFPVNLQLSKGALCIHSLLPDRLLQMKIWVFCRRWQHKALG